MLFLQSLGAIIKRRLQSREEWLVDNGHLGRILQSLDMVIISAVCTVAWSASYSMEHIAAGGGLFSASHPGEGTVCRFRGPRTVYIQTRNPRASDSGW